MRRPLASFAAFVLCTAAAGAEESTLNHGQRLVETNCVKCHAVSETGDSPLKAAPPFRDVALNYTQEELVDGFMEGLAVRHKEMPDWDMSMEQAEAIATYIMGLKRTSAAKSGDSPAVLGHEILMKNCARCHAIDVDGDSPLAKAPPFRDVVTRYAPEQLAEALAEGIVVGHSEMPEFAFTADEVSAIISYLSTLDAN